MTEASEVKHPDLQKAAKDINAVLGTKQNHVAGRQALIDFIVGSIGGCIGPNPENPEEQIWTDQRAGELKPETLATYEALATPAAEAGAGQAEAPEAAGQDKATSEAQDAATEVQPGDEAPAPKECPEFGKGYDAGDPACAKPCKRAEECQTAMAEAAPKKKTAEAAAPKEPKAASADKYRRAHAFCDALRSGPLPKEGLITKTNELYMAKGNADNINESTWAVSTFMKPLLILGTVKEENGVFALQQ